MPKLYRPLLVLVVLSFLAAGCTATGTPTPIPITNTPVPAANTPISTTGTPIPPIVTVPPTNAAPILAANVIAFTAFDDNERSEIKVIQADGRNGQSIPNTSNAATVAWSPDGKRIVFIVHHGDLDWSMYILDADGQNLQRLTQGNLDYNPSWSPDGAQIAFSRNGNLWVMRVSNDPQPVTSDLRQLTTDPKELVWGIAWSPDGAQIAFDSQMGDPRGTASYQDPTTTEIYIIHADGSNLRKLTDNSYIDAGPSWSPDSKQITFFSNRDGDPHYTMKKAFAAKSDGAFQVYSMTADGQNVQRLTDTTANDMQPAWSPDGKQIAFSSNRDGNYEIYVMNADGSHPTRLTDTSTQDYQPTWMPAITPQPTAIMHAYLGQLPPGLTPQVFAPGIISIPSAMDYAATFSLDGTEFYFTRRMNNSDRQNIYETHWANGAWTEPDPVAFSAGYDAHEPHMTADNKTLYFGWFRPPPPGEKSALEAGIWATDRTAGGWSSPRYVGEGMFVSSDKSGQIYVTDFASGSPSLSKATLTDGRFTHMEFIAAGVHPAIAPDGSYLVYDNGDGYLQVKFRLEDGTWGAAKDLSTQGIPISAAIASISPDGQYLFYVDNQDIYWVSTKLIQNLRTAN